MRFWYGNTPVWLPADWVWRIEPAADGDERIRIERASGTRMTLPEAIELAALESSTSKAALRSPIPKPE